MAQGRSGQNDKLKAPAGSKARPSTQVKAAPAPPPDPVVLRKQQLKANRNFDSDSETEAEKSKPRAYNLEQLTQLEKKLSAAEKAAGTKRPAPKPQHVQQPQQQQQTAYKSPYNQAASKGITPTRTILPKGKAGAASRSMALAPQVSTPSCLKSLPCTVCLLFCTRVPYGTIFSIPSLSAVVADFLLSLKHDQVLLDDPDTGMSNAYGRNVLSCIAVAGNRLMRHLAQCCDKCMTAVYACLPNLLT